MNIGSSGWYNLKKTVSLENWKCVRKAIILASPGNYHCFCQCNSDNSHLWRRRLKFWNEYEQKTRRYHCKKIVQKWRISFRTYWESEKRIESKDSLQMSSESEDKHITSISCSRDCVVSEDEATTGKVPADDGTIGAITAACDSAGKSTSIVPASSKFRELVENENLQRVVMLHYACFRFLWYSWLVAKYGFSVLLFLRLSCFFQ